MFVWKLKFFFFVKQYFRSFVTRFTDVFYLQCNTKITEKLKFNNSKTIDSRTWSRFHIHVQKDINFFSCLLYFHVYWVPKHFLSHFFFRVWYFGHYINFSAVLWYILKKITRGIYLPLFPGLYGDLKTKRILFCLTTWAATSRDPVSSPL